MASAAWPYGRAFAQVPADSIRARIQSGRNSYDQAAAPLKAEAAGPTWLPGLQVCTRSQSCPRTDLEWAHPAVPQGPDREGESRSNRVSRRSPAGPANDGFADRHLQQPARVSPRDRQGVLAAFLARPIVVFKAA